MKATRFETEATFVTLLDSGIARIDIKPGEEVTLDIIHKMHPWINENMTTDKQYVMIVPGVGSTADHEVRSYMDTEERSSDIAADAIIVSTIAHRLIVNFYLKYNRPYVPTKVFTNTEAAEKWLVEQVALNKS